MNIGIDARGINLYRGSGIGTYTKNLILNLINSNLKDNFNLLWTGTEQWVLLQSGFRKLWN